MPIHKQVIRAKVFRQVLFLMGHVNVKPHQCKVQICRKIFRPALIIITSYDINRSDLLKLINDLLPVDITSVQDRITTLQNLNNFRSEKPVRI